MSLSCDRLNIHLVLRGGVTTCGRKRQWTRARPRATTAEAFDAFAIALGHALGAGRGLSPPAPVASRARPE
eukprot:scaffold65607_cov63-Phaeocystis_antarctica.AAC.1